MATAASGLSAGLNLYSFFKGVDDSNDEYRKQQDEERKKLEEFRAQEKLARDQQNQAQLELERARDNLDYERKAPAREELYLTAEERLKAFQDEGAKNSRLLGRTAKIGEETIKSQLQIGANEFGAGNLAEMLGQQNEQAKVALDERDARTAQGRLVVDTTNAVTQALRNSPGLGDSKLRGLYADKLAKTPEDRQQEFFNKNNYGITVLGGGKYSMAGSPLVYSFDEINTVIKDPAGAPAKIIEERNSRSNTMAMQARANTTTNNATRIADATVLDRTAGAVKKTADAVATTNANSPTAATTKAAVPPTPSGLSKNIATQAPKAPLAGAVSPPSSGAPPQSFSPAATATPAVNPQTIRNQNKVGGDDVSNEINRMSLSELSALKNGLEDSLKSGVSQEEYSIIANRINEVNMAYGKRQLFENKASRDSESKSKEGLAAKTLADKKAAEKLTQDAAKIRAEDFIAKALAKAKNK